MSSPSPQLPIGHVVGSRYRIQSLIGRGGMGVVYAAVHELTGRRVALKLMVSDLDESPVQQERFLSEARIAAAVRHPNIVDVLDMGLHGGAPFLVMELLEGMSLERLLETEKRVSAEQALAWLFPIVGALAVLHDAGIVHRDVKPSNILLSTLPRHPLRPKLLDFGLARVVSDLRLTRSGMVLGTPLYMAPEHAAGLDTGPQADVWSLGIVLYECLAGSSPFRFSDRSALAAQVLAGAVRPLRELRPDLPASFSVAIGRALQRDLNRRYRDMRSFARALHDAAVEARFALPADPDPIGLPEYRSWQTGSREAAITREQFMFANTESAAWPGDTPSTLSRRLRSKPRAFWAGVLLVLVIGAAYALFGRSERAGPAGGTPAADRSAGGGSSGPSPRPSPEGRGGGEAASSGGAEGRERGGDEAPSSAPRRAETEGARPAGGDRAGAASEASGLSRQPLPEGRRADDQAGAAPQSASRRAAPSPRARASSPKRRPSPAVRPAATSAPAATPQVEVESEWK